MHWRGRAREHEVKLQLVIVGVTRNPLRGLAWSSARTRGNVATFGVPAGSPRNPLRGLAWSSVRTRGNVATFRVPAGFPRNPLRGLAWSSARTRGKVVTFWVPAHPSTSVRSHREKYIDDK